MGVSEASFHKFCEYKLPNLHVKYSKRNLIASFATITIGPALHLHWDLKNQIKTWKMKTSLTFSHRWNDSDMQPCGWDNEHLPSSNCVTDFLPWDDLTPTPQLSSAFLTWNNISLFNGWFNPDAGPRVRACMGVKSTCSQTFQTNLCRTL